MTRLITKETKANKDKEFHQLTNMNRSSISIMKEENQVLQDQLVSQKLKNHQEQEQMNVQLIKLQQECSIYAQKIEIENKRKQDLDQLVEGMKWGSQETSKSESNPGNEVSKCQEQVRKSENKLSRILTKHNIQLAEIQEIKEELNVARRERVIHSTVFKAIERDAIQKQNDYRELILKSEMMKKEISVLMESLQDLHNLSERESKGFEQQYSDVFEGEETEEYSQIQDKILQSSIQNIDETHFLTEPLPNQSRPRQFSNHNDEDQASQEVNQYQQLFEQLFLVTSLKSPELIVQAFNNQEQMIEDIYMEINNFTTNIDQLDQDNHRITINLLKQREREESMRYREQSTESGVRGHKQKMKRVEVTIYEAKKALREQQDIMQQIQSALDIQVLDDEVTDWNLNQYSKVLEAKINDIMTACQSIQRNTSPRSQGSSANRVREQQTYVEDNENDDSQVDYGSARLDEILGNMDKMKEAEKILNPKDLKAQSFIILQSKDSQLKKRIIKN